MGAIFEKYFEIEGKEEAEKIALTFHHSVLKNKNKVLSMSMEQINDPNNQNRGLRKTHLSNCKKNKKPISRCEIGFLFWNLLSVQNFRI